MVLLTEQENQWNSRRLQRPEFSFGCLKLQPGGDQHRVDPFRQEIRVRGLGSICIQAIAGLRKEKGASPQGEMVATGRTRTESWKHQHFQGQGGRRANQGGKKAREELEQGDGHPGAESFKEEVSDQHPRDVPPASVGW